MASKRQRAEPPADETLTVSIQLVGLESAPLYYANHVEVAHNPHEFELIFSRVPAKLSKELVGELKKTGAIEVEPLARVIIPPSLMAPLQKVLEAQVEKFHRLVTPSTPKEEKKR